MSNDNLNSNSSKNEVLELTRKIFKNGKIIDLKEEREKNKISREDQIFIGVAVESDFEDAEDSKAYQAYLKYRTENSDLNLRSHIKKVNLPEVNNNVSVFSHEDNILSQAIVLTIVNFIKPLFIMGVNLPKDDNLNKIAFDGFKQYIKLALTKIKIEVINRYLGSRIKKISVKSSLDERLTDAESLFLELLINHFLLWLKIGFVYTLTQEDNSEELEIKLGLHIDNFLETELEKILDRISY